MKQILVISDIHGSADNLEAVLGREKYSDVIFCGDGIRDVMESRISPSAGRFFVRGNADRHFFGNIKYELTVGIHGRLFFITHGDEYGVKDGIGSLLLYCRENYIDIAVFGHTHSQMLREESGIIFFNPGSLISGNYGLIKCSGRKYSFVHKKL
ncbi:MAG: YfcE family phosphodiesterase [Spirochaetes bacterium]|nr:YfcE family phosphodiesterase [Spirochaetota bacterium]